MHLKGPYSYYILYIQARDNDYMLYILYIVKCIEVSMMCVDMH